MKVKSCSAKESTKRSSNGLSFKEMSATEGIYKSTGPHNTRFIVLQNAEGKLVTLSYYEDRLVPNDGTNWKGITFTPCYDEEICFEIRKKEE